MNEWLALLLVLALIQIRFYELSVRKLIALALPYILILAFGLVISDAVWNFFDRIGLEWWAAVVTAFVCFLIGETFSLVLKESEKIMKRKGQNLPSFLTFSVLFAALARVSGDSPAVFFGMKGDWISVPLASLLVSVVLAAIRERLALSNIPKSWQGAPILLLSAAFLLLVFGRIAALW